MCGNGHLALLVTMRVVFPADASLKAGDAITITFAEIPGDPIVTAIREIKDGQATAEFANANPAVRPGMPICPQNEHALQWQPQEVKDRWCG